ncbi:hypothetical protein [Pseudomonas sp. ML96]|uniref:hypothetical protein n=1 Tax=Pseudomonas sp. ML96 TaxID=1523503 RepID=UPI0005B84FD5|nr:hypothetical protein [Pseudomonas sp. ML96]
MRVLVFPGAFMANTFAMMVVMIGLSLFGKPELAADFGLTHGATVALFYSLSGNARSLILAGLSEFGAVQILRLRLLLIVPLGMFSWLLCAGLVGGGWLFVLLLVVRRAAEWLAEVFLSEQELQNDGVGAARFLLLQVGMCVLLLLVLIDGGALVIPMTLIWALSPLCGCVRRNLIKRAIADSTPLLANVRLLLPHFGSTMVIGVSVYAFRLFLLLIAGKQIAGDLFSAFAMGGILGTIFTQALGPTMVRHEQRASVRGARMVKLFDLVLLLVLAAGVGLGLSVRYLPGVLQWTQKADLFWLAVSFSLVGGVVMVAAQRIRLRIIQSEVGADVFGSDMLSNLMLLASIPLLFYAFGVEALAALYLLGSVLSWMFYASERNGLLPKKGVGWMSENRILLLTAIAILVPLFFQLDGGLFGETSGGFVSGGVLSLLPIPLSVLACYVSIVLLGQYSQVRLSLVSLFFVFIGMLLTSLLLGLTEGGAGRQKLILLIQYILPMSALVLGQQFGSHEDALEMLARAALAVLVCLVPLQLISTVSTGGRLLSPSVYLFSIYQHLHYVSFLFAAAFVLGLCTLWEQSPLRRWLCGLALLMGSYTIFAWSLLTNLMLLSGVILFVVQQSKSKSERSRALTVPLFILVGAAITIAYLWQMSEGGAGLDMLESRVNYLGHWFFYLSGMTDGWMAALLGHATSPSRAVHPSAFNYYLDFAYHFGLLGLLPLLLLVAYTGVSILQNLQAFWADRARMALAVIVILMLSIDSVFKVGLRQPYSGVIMFFFWGVLLAVILQMSVRPRYNDK